MVSRSEDSILKKLLLLISLAWAVQFVASVPPAMAGGQTGRPSTNPKPVKSKRHDVDNKTPPGWYSYISPDGTNGIAFPGKPIDRSRTEQTELGPVPMTVKMYATANSRRQYYLMVGRHDVDARSQNVEKSLDFWSRYNVEENKRHPNWRGQDCLPWRYRPAIYRCNTGRGQSQGQGVHCDFGRKADYIYSLRGG